MATLSQTRAYFQDHTNELVSILFSLDLSAPPFPTRSTLVFRPTNFIHNHSTKRCQQAICKGSPSFKPGMICGLEGR